MNKIYALLKILLIIIMIKKANLLSKNLRKSNKIWFFSSYHQIEQQLQLYSDQINASSSSSKQLNLQMVQQYIHLSQQSFLKKLSGVSHDIKFLLMTLTTLQEKSSIRQHIQLLYPYIDQLQPSQLIFFLQYIVSIKPTLKPALPRPKPILNQHESILVLLNQIYSADQLIFWLEQVGMYEGKNWYIIAMGIFSICSKMSKQCQLQYKLIIQKCLERLLMSFRIQTIDIQIGIIILAMQSKMKLTQKLYINMDWNLHEIDFYKMLMLLINTVDYINNIKLQKQQLSNCIIFMQQINTKIIIQICKYNWYNNLKIYFFIKLWYILQYSQLDYQWLQLRNKLINFTINKNNFNFLKNLKITQILTIMITMQKFKINQEKLLKILLTLVYDNLENLNAEQYIILCKFLITYVRQSEDYLLGVRKIMERRIFIFNIQQKKRINQIFKRVRILFPNNF